jgi:hypothetical protein
VNVTQSRRIELDNCNMHDNARIGLVVSAERSSIFLAEPSPTTPAAALWSASPGSTSTLWKSPPAALARATPRR